jgi:hypothetical protein
MRAVVRELRRRRLVAQPPLSFTALSSLAPSLVTVRRRSRGPPLAA